MRGLKVLHVDDEADIRTVVAMALSLDPAIEARAAASGDEALAMLSAGPHPDLVVLDVMMPGLNGLQVLDRIRADPATANIPVIFMTANGRRADIRSYHARGAIGVIVKPFDPALLASDIRAILASSSE